MRRCRLAVSAGFASCLLPLGVESFAVLVSPSRKPPAFERSGQRRKLGGGRGRRIVPPTEELAMSSIDGNGPEVESGTVHDSTDSDDKSGRNDERSLVPKSSEEISSLLGFLGGESTSRGGPPPLQIEDNNLLLYDVFLLLNLSVSISFWVVHRMSFLHIASAFSEGSLLAILWIAAGLANGAFLNSAVDGHYDPRNDEGGKGGPKAAGLLGLSTFVSTASLRIVVALTLAGVQHRQVGAVDGEMLIPMEIAVGLVLMSVWRALHSSYTPRI